jgi:hypothetical protein
VKKEFLQMERDGIIRRSNSPSTERKISGYLWRTESANCCSRKYMEYYVKKGGAPGFIKPVVH